MIYYVPRTVLKKTCPLASRICYVVVMEGLITFAGEFHIHNKITNYKKVFDSDILCLLFFLMFLAIL